MSSSTSSFRRYGIVFAAVFASCLVAMVAMTEALVRTALLPGEKSDAFVARLKASHAPFAAFGDSHVADGVDGSEKIDNFGVASDNLDTVAARIAFRLSGTGLEGVVLQADPQVFSLSRIRADQRLRVEEMRSDAPPLLAIMRTEYRSYLVGYFWTVMRNPGLLLGWPADAAPPSERKAKGQGRVAEDVAQIRAQLHAPLAQFVDSRVAQDYRRLVADLKSRGIAVCLVSFPVSGAYRKAASGLPSFVAAYTWFEDEAKRQGIRYLNYSTLYDDSVFLDPDHLTSDEAPEFTRRVLTDCFGVPLPTGF